MSTPEHDLWTWTRSESPCVFSHISCRRPPLRQTFRLLHACVPPSVACSPSASHSPSLSYFQLEMDQLIGKGDDDDD